MEKKNATKKPEEKSSETTAKRTSRKKTPFLEEVEPFDITPTVQPEEDPLKKVILNPGESVEERAKVEIKKFNVTDSRLTELKEKYTGFKILPVPEVDASDEDKKAFKLSWEAGKAAVSEIRKIRTGADKKALEITEDYRKIVTLVNGEKKRIISEVEPLEDPIQEQLDAIKKTLDDREQEFARKMEEEGKQRVTDLIAAGLVFNGSIYTLGEISLDVNVIKGLTQESFEALKSKVLETAKRIQDEKEEDDRKKQEELDDLKKKQEEQEKKDAQLKKEQEDLENQKAEMKKQITDFRKQQLESNGLFLVTSLDCFILDTLSGKVSVSISEIESDDNSVWFEKIKSITIQANDIKSKESARIENDQKEEKRKQEAENLFIKRRASLQAIGYVFDDVFYQIWHKGNGLKEPISTIKGATDEEFNFIYTNAAAKVDEIEEMKESERKIQEVADSRRDQLLQLGFAKSNWGYFFKSNFSAEIIQFLFEDLNQKEEDWKLMFDQGMIKKEQIIKDDEIETKRLQEEQENKRVAGLSNVAKIEEFIPRVQATFESFPKLEEGSALQKELALFMASASSLLGSFIKELEVYKSKN